MDLGLTLKLHFVVLELRNQFCPFELHALTFAHHYLKTATQWPVLVARASVVLHTVA